MAWEDINSVIRSKKVYSKETLTDDEKKDIDESELPSKFINYFTSNARQLTSEIPPTQLNVAS